MIIALVVFPKKYPTVDGGDNNNTHEKNVSRLTYSLYETDKDKLNKSFFFKTRIT